MSCSEGVVVILQIIEFAIKSDKKGFTILWLCCWERRNGILRLYLAVATLLAIYLLGLLREW